MSRQFFLFLVIGGIQYLLDASVFALLIFVLPAETANVLARMAGAAAGYFLNGIFTFKALDKENRIQPVMLLKFVTVWGGMTLLSTLAIRSGIEWLDTGDWYAMVAVKLMVEMLLVILSFTLQKCLVYR